MLKNNNQLPNTTREVHQIVPLAYNYDKSPPPSYTKLIKAMYNPNENSVKCPEYEYVFRGHKSCRPTKQPCLIIQHHSVKGLQLWGCEKCDYCLLRVDVNGIGTSEQHE